VDAIEEAIAILRAAWSGEATVSFEGAHYRVPRFDPGPPPAHRIGIWLGAYGPRMMRVVGRLADGWLPSVPRLPPEEVPARHTAIDDAARAAGRDPADIRRACNLNLQGEPGTWADQCVRMVTEFRMQTLFLGAADDGDPVGLVRRLGEDVAPAVRAR
jgi:alkanesulfonate monooxygenase SsuD/methylene tetrahydromethanopterin reductase-like flavin-dependent oxidoreductase (luciferase family)